MTAPTSLPMTRQPSLRSLNLSRSPSMASISSIQSRVSVHIEYKTGSRPASTITLSEEEDAFDFSDGVCQCFGIAFEF